MVLKFDHVYGRDSCEIGELARQMSEYGNYTRNMFTRIPELILPESIMICTNPMRERSCVVTIQPYIEPFVDYREIGLDDWELLFENFPMVKKQIGMFRDVIVNDWTRQDILPDIVGKNNLVVNNGRLILLDSLPARPVGKWEDQYRKNYVIALRQVEVIADL